MRYIRATAEDQARIQEFLSQFVDDYLSKNIGAYVSRDTGGLYLAVDEQEQIAALAVIDLIRPKEAHLGGLRVRPDLQNGPAASEFMEFQVQESKRLGAAVIRALVGRGNELSQQALQEKLGFHVVDEWVVGSIQGFEAPEYPDGGAGPAWAVDRDRLRAFFKEHSEDLWSDRTQWLPRSLTFDDVWHGVELGAAAIAPQDVAEAVDTFALFEIHDGDMHVKYLRSMGHHLKSLMQYLWVECRAWGVNTLRFGLPRQAADKLAEAAGVPLSREWNGVVLEMHVGLTSTSMV